MIELNINVQTLLMSVQAVDAEIGRIKASVKGAIDELEPDAQELLLAYSQAAMELKVLYVKAREFNPGLPAYESLISGV